MKRIYKSVTTKRGFFKNTGLLSAVLFIYFLLPDNFCSAQSVINFSPQKNGVTLSWTHVEGVEGYNLYRSESRYGEFKRINAAPVRDASFSDNNGKYAYYKIAPVTAGKEGTLSAPQSFELELFGQNTYIFNPNDSHEAMKQVIDTITKEMADGRISQFTNNRVAFLFKPGDYDWLQFENGFYMQVAGLGRLPVETKIDKVYVTTDWLRNKNATCNFWRAIENVSLLNRDGEMLIYGISQAAPIRRMMIHGDINLDMGGWSSGGFLANSVVTGTAGSPTQQQFFIRNNETKFSGVNWNLVSVGNVGEIEMRNNRTIIASTPVIYEKPFLFFENGDYFVFVPARMENSSGATWSNGKIENGKIIPLSDFYIAHDDKDNAKTLNTALAQGKHLLFTPGIYKVSEAIEVTKANTVVLGLGLASIQPVNGNNGMYVADVEGIRIAGLIFDAGAGTNANTGTGGTEILLQVGPRGSKNDLSGNPIVLSDLFFRVGGANTPLPCKADISLEINANATIGDHFWIWRADHGGQVGWYLNKADYGMVVNGNDVTVYGLFVEHYQKYDTYWKGENGRMYFYQNEKAYDVPTQAEWIGPDGNGNGWAAYRIADDVTKHEAWGVGVYSVFIRTKDFVLLENAILTPEKGDIAIHYPFTINLSNNGGIEHIINGVGGPHTSKESPRGGSPKILPESYNNVWRSGGNAQEKGIRIIEKGGKFLLMIDGVETYIKGVGGTNRLDMAVANGANAFRTWGGNVERAKSDLIRAKELNMYVMQGIGLPNDSARYNNEEFKEQTRTSVRALAEALKNEPNLLVWGIGNEIEHNTANTPTAWSFVNELALMIKSIDRRHLVSTVISHNAKALNLIAEYAPDLDVVGINSYGAISQVEKMVADSKYKGAYIISEWGPTGWWETARTAWRAPLEQTSEEKRIVYEERYNNYIKNSPRCLGSFVFLWGQKEERTPTWFSMFVENNVAGLPLKGEKTPMVEAMERVWQGVEPKQTAPVVHNIFINDIKPADNIYVKSGTAFTCKVEAVDREGDKMTYVWEILKEATVTATGGAYEPRPDRIGEVQTTSDNTLKTVINEPGEYRFYVYVLDGTGFVSTANAPFQVQ